MQEGRFWMCHCAVYSSYYQYCNRCDNRFCLMYLWKNKRQALRLMLEHAAEGIYRGSPLSLGLIPASLMEPLNISEILYRNILAQQQVPIPLGGVQTGSRYIYLYFGDIRKRREVHVLLSRHHRSPSPQTSTRTCVFILSRVHRQSLTLFHHSSQSLSSFSILIWSPIPCALGSQIDHVVTLSSFFVFEELNLWTAGNILIWV